MVIRVGSGTNELPSTMIRFSTRIKSLHILGNFSGRVWRRFDKLPCSLKSLFGSCLFAHDGASTSNKELDGFNNSLWHQQDPPIEACLAMASTRAVRLWVRVFKTETEIGTPARVEAETWKFARQRGCSRALGTRGLYVLWNYCAANSYAATPDSARSESGARADWQACTTHGFLLDHRTSCTVFLGIVVFAMTIMARSFTTHLTSFVVHRVRFGPDSRESGPNPGTGLT